MGIGRGRGDHGSQVLRQVGVANRRAGRTRLKGFDRLEGPCRMAEPLEEGCQGRIKVFFSEFFLVVEIDIEKI